MENYLNSHQFFDEVWMLIPEELVSNKYMHENDSLIKEITFSFYKDYAEDRISINVAARIISNMFQYFFKYKPLLSNSVDDYLINSMDED